MTRPVDPIDQKNTHLENKYAFEVARLPNIKYFCRRITLPGLTLGSIEVPSVFRTVPYPGTKLSYDQQFMIEFDVDVNMSNWKEIFTWMRGLGMPDNFEQYQSQTKSGAGVSSDDGLVCDGRLLLYNNSFALNTVLYFERIFPVALSPLNLQSTSADVLTCSATFAYSKFDIQE
jgi:hypothetical protein